MLVQMAKPIDCVAPIRHAQVMDGTVYYPGLPPLPIDHFNCSILIVAHLQPGGMADPQPKPPWKFWLKVGSAAFGVSVGIGWLIFPVLWVLTLFLVGDSVGWLMFPVWWVSTLLLVFLT